MKTELEQIRIGSNTNPGSAAGYIVRHLAEHGEAELWTIGPRANFRAIKAVAIARDMLSGSGTDITAAPNFATVRIDGEDKQAIRTYLVAVPVQAMEAEKETADLVREIQDRPQKDSEISFISQESMSKEITPLELMGQCVNQALHREARRPQTAVHLSGSVVQKRT